MGCPRVLHIREVDYPHEFHVLYTWICLQGEHNFRNQRKKLAHNHVLYCRSDFQRIPVLLSLIFHQIALFQIIIK